MLKTLVQKTLLEKGPLPFSQFMEMVLYHPELGYYSKSRTQEDYYTNADVHPVFAKILAQYFYDEWKKSGEGKFSIVELGSGEGKLAREILSWISREARAFYEQLTYTCIERGTRRVHACQELKKVYPGHVEVSSQFDFAPDSVRGIIFSNEFFDALAFDRVIKKGGELFEVTVDSDFNERTRPLSRPIGEFFDWLGEAPEESCVGEAQLDSRTWMQKISQALRSGLILTIDYGFEAKELYAPWRTEGTALCHLHHQTHKDFYSHLGEQDITAHVNFTVLEKEGGRWGLEPDRLKTQSQFLLECGLETLVQTVGNSPDPRSRLQSSNAVKSLIHPEGMGGTFKVLIQRKRPRII